MFSKIMYLAISIILYSACFICNSKNRHLSIYFNFNQLHLHKNLDQTTASKPGCLAEAFILATRLEEWNKIKKISCFHYSWLEIFSNTIELMVSQVFWIMPSCQSQSSRFRETNLIFLFIFYSSWKGFLVFYLSLWDILRLIRMRKCNSNPTDLNSTYNKYCNELFCF